MRKFFDAVQIIIGSASFIALLGFTGACEQGGSISDYVVRAFISLAILSVDAIIYHARHKGEPEVYYDED